MAKQYRVMINRPMLEALRKLLRGRKECPVCNEAFYAHSSVTLDGNGQVVSCSNVEG